MVPEEETNAKAMFLIRFLFIQNGHNGGPFATPTSVIMKRFECSTPQYGSHNLIARPVSGSNRLCTT
jgi:hypothetical protein